MSTPELTAVINPGGWGHGIPVDRDVLDAVLEEFDAHFAAALDGLSGQQEPTDAALRPAKPGDTPGTVEPDDARPQPLNLETG